MVAISSTAIEAPALAEESYLYELVPLLPLPEVDLSVSVKSRFVRSRRMHRLIRAVARSPFTFMGYIIYMGVGIAVYFVPAHHGRILAIIGLLLGLPGTLIPIGNLRLEVVAVLIKTYDTWFFGIVSTVLAVVLGMVLNDVRAVLMVISWLSFMVNICVDASVLGLQQIWIVNTFAMISFAIIAVAVSIEITDGLNTFQLVRINSHELPAVAAVRDCLITMIILIGRIIVRKHKYALKKSKAATASTDFQCVSFRCRLQLRAAEEQTPDGNPDRRTSKPSSVHFNEASSKVKLRFKADFDSIDIRNTLVRMQWPSRTRRRWQPFPWIGVVGFVLTNVIYLLNMAWPQNDYQQVQLPIVVLAACASNVFVGTCIAVMQRQLLRAIVTYFDFLFIAIEVTFLHIALADILGWHLVTTIAIFSDLQWCTWMLSWDALTPPVRKRLGLSRHYAAYIGMSLMGVLASGMIIVFIVRPPDAIQDRVVYRITLSNHSVELRSLTMYFSCVATISTWSLRVLWRLVTLSGSEMIMLDGAVVYDINRLTEPRVGSRRQQRVTQDPKSLSRQKTNLIMIPSAK